jgi:hypothetical protein
VNNFSKLMNFPIHVPMIVPHVASHHVIAPRRRQDRNQLTPQPHIFLQADCKLSTYKPTTHTHSR